MKKIIALALAVTLSTSVLAAGVSETYLGTVEDVNCVQVGQNESIVGGVVGGGVGAVGGALVGSLFGKTGKKLGAIAGGLGGAAYGGSGNKVYNCTLLVQVGTERAMVNKQTEQLIERGQSVKVVKLGNGQWGTL